MHESSSFLRFFPVEHRHEYGADTYEGGREGGRKGLLTFV